MRGVPLVSSYAELIADWPVVVLGVCTVLIVVCALVGILVPDLPDFSDPLLVSEGPHCACFSRRTINLSDSRSCTLVQSIKCIN